jgi:hypothetical protein
VPLLAATPNRAHVCAAENRAENVRALLHTQPDLIDPLSESEPGVEWVFGRDGALTARDTRGRWAAGCSLPRRAAREMLRKLEVHGSVACFLAPPHAAQVSVALEFMRPEQAIVALVPTVDHLRAILCCENFADAISSHRLWLVAGELWPAQLAKLYEEHPGLAPPAQFIRVPASPDELIEPLVNEAQQVISQVTTRRSRQMQSVRARPWTKPSVTRLCVVAPTRFRLWNDLGHALVVAAREAAHSSDDLTWTLYDADDPAFGSPLALAETARQCSALLTANTARCDLPGVLPIEMPWLTWVTAPRIPSFSAAGLNDQLLLANAAARDVALRQGWPPPRVHVATWPTRMPPPDDFAKAIAIIADTRVLDVPEDLNDYSSHTLLWEAIRDELLHNPRTLGDDTGAYLTTRMRKMCISPDVLPTHRFIEQLIIPAYQQGVARAMFREQGRSVQLHGECWDRIGEFARHAHGPVASRHRFDEVVAASRALVHVWPTRHAHPIDHTGRPVLRLGSASPAAPRIASPPLSGEILRKIMLGS